MIRLLIWVGVVLALLGFFYKSRDGGARKQALRSERSPARQGAAASVAVVKAATTPPASAPPAARPNPPVAAPIAAVAAHRARPIGRGLSFALADEATLPARVAHLACHGEPVPIDRPHRGSCNPHEGDTSCRIILPNACYRSTGAAAPPNLAPDSHGGWTHGRLAATQPLLGALLTSEPDASARCEAELGAGWRMAEFHDGGAGWGLQGERGAAFAPVRYWVYIDDQRGNCWNSAP